MDKTDAKVHENQSDTSSVITMKEYASSEYPSSEPPPAYIKPRSNALRIARLAAFTIVVSSVILGGFILAASWIQANAARNLDLTLNQELLDDLHPSYEHLVANEVLPDQQENALGQESAKQSVRDKSDSAKDKNENVVPPFTPQQSQQDKKSLDLDEIANMLVQKNIKGNVNCIVEKRRNEELVDHAPRSLNLPFGLNITTPPRLQHMTGEQMVVICKGDEEDEKENEDKEEQMTPMVFPLPSHLVNQMNQVPQVIPISQLLQQIPMQQVQQYPVQPQMIQQQQSPEVYYHQPYVYPQQMQPQQQPRPQQMIYPQQMTYPQQQQQPPMNDRPEIRFQPEMIPLREVRLNQERIPMNHVMHNRVPVDPMATKDVPLSQMPFTHLPIKTEPQMDEEPIPVHHLVPPQPQEPQAENFNQDDWRMPQPVPRYERPNPMPYFPQQNRARMIEERESRLLRNQRPFPIPIFHSNDVESNVPASENREVETEENAGPVEGRAFPFPPRPFPERIPERNPESPKIIKMIPFDIESRRPFPRRIRFPDSGESENNRLPVITEITKIIPIRIQKEEPKINRIPMIPLSRPNNENQPPMIKNFNEIDDKIEKMPERPFPIPINAILDMIFRGIKPLVNNRNSAIPIPIDIKIERIENGPSEGSTGRPLTIEKFEIFEKESQNSREDDDEESHENPEPSTLMLNDVNKSEKSESNENDQNKDMIEAKVEKVEIFDKEGESTRPIPIPADAQDPQIFKIEETPNSKENPEPENRAFLPNGQGRGARVFPIPPQFREAEIFSVSDARAGKNVNLEIPVESSFTVEAEEKAKAPQQAEGRQAKVMNFRQPVEGEINLFPLPEGRAMKPFDIRPRPQTQPQTFTINDAKSVKLLPVSDNAPPADFKPVSVAPANPQNSEEMRHFVQPRSV